MLLPLLCSSLRGVPRLSKKGIFKTNLTYQNVMSNLSYHTCIPSSALMCLQFPHYQHVFSVRNYCKSASKKLHREVEDFSDSDSDSDDESKTRGQTREESEFWRRKMRTFHGILDINKDGVISFDDFKILVDRFIDLGHLSPHHQKEFIEVIQRMWEERWGSIDPYNLVTTEQYLEDMHHILNDKSLRKKVHNFLPYLFKAVDRDRSGSISVEEYKMFFKCLGLSYEAAVVSFNVIDENSDGRLSLKEFVKLGRDFFLTQNETKPSRMFWGPLLP